MCFLSLPFRELGYEGYVHNVWCVLINSLIAGFHTCRGEWKTGFPPPKNFLGGEGMPPILRFVDA